MWDGRIGEQRQIELGKGTALTDWVKFVKLYCSEMLKTRVLTAKETVWPIKWTREK